MVKIDKEKPAILGGKPALDEFLPIIKPTLPKIDGIKNEIDDVLSSGMLTNHKYVKELEKSVAEYIGVKHAIAVNSATSGLMLVLKALNIKEEVIVPSFTFVATTHSLVWNNIAPVFVDCEADTFNMDANKIESMITDKTSAIMPVHMFGNPCDADAISEIADKHGLKVIIDAAHAMGSLYNKSKVGRFGDAEIFSMAPTKIVTAGEGGMVTTNNKELAEKIMGGRDYGNFGNYDCRFIGLSARLCELNAILGKKSLDMLEKNITMRNKLVRLFKKEVEDVKGLRFQIVRDTCRSSYYTFSLVIDEKKFGMNRLQLAEALKKENIMTKQTYFDPPVHKQESYVNIGRKGSLDVTENLSKNIISVPLFSHMPEEKMIAVANAVKKIHKNSKEVIKALGVKK